jgi:hypothetical protein
MLNFIIYENFGISYKQGPSIRKINEDFIFCLCIKKYQQNHRIL